MPSMANPIAQCSVAIDAPIELVWQVMTDFDRYAEWNPFVVQIERRGGAPVRIGTFVTLHVRWPRGRGGATTVEVVTRIDAPAATADGERHAHLEYRYTGWFPRLRLITGSRLQTLAQPAGGPTTYRTFEEFHGMLKSSVPLRKVQAGFEAHAEALKTRSEGLARGAGAPGQAA